MPSCTTCSGNNANFTRMPCAVCTDQGDPSEKWVYFCDLCVAYICKEHEDKWVQRAVAATNVLINKIIKKPKQ